MYNELIKQINQIKQSDDGILTLYNNYVQLLCTYLHSSTLHLACFLLSSTVRHCHWYNCYKMEIF